MIRNSAKHFPVFVSNCLVQLEDRSTSFKWRFVPSLDNPADDGARPCSVNRWLTGPSFLQQSELLWPQPPHFLPDLPAEFEIVKRTVAGTEVAVSDGDMEERFARFSSFYRLKRRNFSRRVWSFATGPCEYSKQNFETIVYKTVQTLDR